jgi:hypothetical protein
MDLKEAEARNDCAGKAQQQFNQLTDRQPWHRLHRKHRVAYQWLNISSTVAGAKSKSKLLYNWQFTTNQFALACIRCQVKVKVTLRLTVSQSVNLGVEPHMGLMTRYLLLFDSYGLVSVGRPV